MKLYRKTYKNCSDLPLLNFIKIVTKDDLKQLYCDKDNWLLNPDLESIWNDIFMEYTELSQDKQGTHVFGLIKEIQVLRNKINSINYCIEILTNANDLDKFKPTIQALKSLTGVFYSFTKETLLQDLKNTINVAKKFVIQYEIALKEYNEIAKDEQAKATEMDYMAEIAFINSDDGLGANLKLSDSTIMYIAYKKQLKSKVNG